MAWKLGEDLQEAAKGTEMQKFLKEEVDKFKLLVYPEESMRLIVKTMITQDLSVKLGKLWSRGCTLHALCVMLRETRCFMHGETCGSRFLDG